MSSQSRTPPKSFVTQAPAVFPKVLGTGVPKNIQDVQEALKKKFGDSVVKRVVEGQPGDPFVVLSTDKIVEAIQFLRDDERFYCSNLLVISCVDYLAQKIEATENSPAQEVKPRIEVVYVLQSYVHKFQVMLKVELDRENPKVASISSLYRSANWYEREVYDMMGVVFDGHPNLKRILLPTDWVGHPLRKDYVFPEEYNGMKVPL